MSYGFVMVMVIFAILAIFFLLLPFKGRVAFCKTGGGGQVSLGKGHTFLIL